MTNIVMCPKCGGLKKVSFIERDVNTWFSSYTPTCPCPTCDGKGWVDTEVGAVSQDDFDNVKFVALSAMETAENMMDECTKRADRIKELEADITCLEADVKGFNRREEELLETIYDLTGENKRLEIDLELLDEMLKIVNPLIKSGAYARPSTESIQLAIQMHRLCQTVVQFRRKHNIVGAI